MASYFTTIKNFQRTTGTMMVTLTATALATTDRTITDFGMPTVSESVPLTPTAPAATVMATSDTCAGTRGKATVTR